MNNNNNIKIGLYIFRRDLRLIDNLGLNELSKKVDYIIPIFIIDKNQIKKNKNNKNYYSDNAVQFILESVYDLNNEIMNYNNKLQLFYGNYKKIIKDIIIKIIEKNKYELYVGFNNDFSNYAIERDNYIINLCQENNIKIISNKNDLILIDIDEMVNKKKSAYKQFGVFYKKAIQYQVNKIKYDKIKFINLKLDYMYEYDIKKLTNLYIINDQIAQNGGRTNGLKKLSLLKKMQDYNDNRNYLNYKTTNISAYLNIGCISIRELYWKLIEINEEKNSDLIKQLYWRDFYLQAFKYINNANNYYEHIDSRFDNIKWINNEIEWQIMLDGKTGYLLIDAGINELKTTGYIHGRMRILLGIFWTKYLLINPFNKQYGSQVGFSKYLVDAIGSTQNLMNHRWLTEFDYSGKKYSVKNTISGRKISIDNKQIKKYDKNCDYIKFWLPHLKNVSNIDLHNWNQIIANKYNNIHPYYIFDQNERYNEWIKISHL